MPAYNDWFPLFRTERGTSKVDAIPEPILMMPQYSVKIINKDRTAALKVEYMPGAPAPLRHAGTDANASSVGPDWL